jgi:hypothetical protein
MAECYERIACKLISLKYGWLIKSIGSKSGLKLNNGRYVLTIIGE